MAVPLITNFALFTSSGEVTWNPNGNFDGTRYKVVVSTNALFTYPIVYEDVPLQEPGESMSKSYKFVGLTPNLPYFVRVDAHGHNAKVIASNVPAERETIPADVVSLSFVPTGDKSRELILTWDKKDNSDRTKYVVGISSDAGTSWKETRTGANVSTFVFGGLQSNHMYRARVQAVNGNLSNELSTYSWPSTPEQVRSVALPFADATHQLKFEWDHGNNVPTTAYAVTLSTGEGIEKHVIRDQVPTNAGVKSILFDETDGVVWANQKYSVEVQAQSSFDAGLYSGSLSTTAFTAPLAAENFGTLAVTSTTVSVHWDAPAVGGVGNSPNSTYLLRWRSDAQALQGLPYSQESSFQKELDSLNPNTTYYIDVVTIPTAESSWVGPVVAGVWATAPTKATLNLGGLIPHPSSMTVQFNGNNNGLNTRYRVDFLDSSAGTVTSIFTDQTRFVTSPTLQPATLYKVSVHVLGHSGKLHRLRKMNGWTKRLFRSIRWLSLC
ncbi:MAG: fibronectin type III domain-containing protein [Elusimicrobia bacterium]|nr:fibronectin type III domain-containing protein [Elusimicrobiota bacterium]